MPTPTTAWRCAGCGAVHAEFAKAEKCEDFHGSLAERHQMHYRSCGCLGYSAECCDPTCPCVVPVTGREGKAHPLRRD